MPPTWTAAINITDSQSGFRAFAADTKEVFRFNQNGLAIESEMLADAANAGLLFLASDLVLLYRSYRSNAQLRTRDSVQH